MGLIVLNARSDLAFEVAFNWESFGGIAQNELQFSDQILSGALMSVLLPLILSKSALFFFLQNQLISPLDSNTVFTSGTQAMFKRSKMTLQCTGEHTCNT